MWTKLIPVMFAEIQRQREAEDLKARQIEWFKNEAAKRGWDMSSFPSQ
jgi:hypothetical protein